MRNLLVCCVLFLTCFLTSFPTQAAGRVVHKERSLYQTIHVVKDRAKICLQFSVRRDQRNQSCIDTRNPQEMQFSYTKMMMAALLLVEQPESVLMIGLGGGTIPTALHELYPQAIIDVVEIDPAVVRMAREYFGFTSDERLRVYEQDARVFTRRAKKKGQRYDLILLDAFNGEYIPEHLMTREYLEDNRQMLTERGVLAANTFAVSDLYDHESATYADVFGTFYNFKIWQSANRVILARPAGLPEDTDVLKPRAAELQRLLKPYNVPIRRYVKDLAGRKDWDESARVLTDQYSPANLLKNR